MVKYDMKDVLFREILSLRYQMRIMSRINLENIYSCSLSFVLFFSTSQSALSFYSRKFLLPSLLRTRVCASGTEVGLEN